MEKENQVSGEWTLGYETPEGRDLEEALKEEGFVPKSILPDGETLLENTLGEQVTAGKEFGLSGAAGAVTKVVNRYDQKRPSRDTIWSRVTGVKVGN